MPADHPALCGTEVLVDLGVVQMVDRVPKYSKRLVQVAAAGDGNLSWQMEDARAAVVEARWEG